jgi:hypothetical protein
LPATTNLRVFRPCATRADPPFPAVGFRRQIRILPRLNGSPSRGCRLPHSAKALSTRHPRFPQSHLNSAKSPQHRSTIPSKAVRRGRRSMASPTAVHDTTPCAADVDHFGRGLAATIEHWLQPATHWPHGAILEPKRYGRARIAARSPTLRLVASPYEHAQQPRPANRKQRPCRTQEQGHRHMAPGKKPIADATPIAPTRTAHPWPQAGDPLSAPLACLAPPAPMRLPPRGWNAPKTRNLHREMACASQ